MERLTQQRSDFYDARCQAFLPPSGAGQIKSAPGSTRVVDGLIHRLDSADEADQLLSGEVLVTAMTDVSWMPLFPRLAAVVTNVGAPLSHAAIIARELGLPNVFMPNRLPQDLREQWVSNKEQLDWEVPLEGGRLACYSRRTRMDTEKMILYPELIYRRYEGERLLDESILKIAMRCYYPDEFSELIRGYGFEIIKRWGGYQGEAYGQGPELIVQFKQTT